MPLHCSPLIVLFRHWYRLQHNIRQLTLCTDAHRVSAAPSASPQVAMTSAGCCKPGIFFSPPRADGFNKFIPVTVKQTVLTRECWDRGTRTKCFWVRFICTQRQDEALFIIISKKEVLFFFQIILNIISSYIIFWMCHVAISNSIGPITVYRRYTMVCLCQRCR